MMGLMFRLILSPIYKGLVVANKVRPFGSSVFPSYEEFYLVTKNDHILMKFPSYPKKKKKNELWVRLIEKLEED